jgi:guanylate kinase
MTGRLVVLSGPSGVGKTTVGAALLRSCRGLVRSVSATTRKPRPGERDGRDYRFVTERAFAALARQGGFLEHARVHARRYGTPRRPVEAALRRGRDVLLVIDVQGAEKVRRLLPQAVLVFLMPPSRTEWMRRLRGRGSEGEAEILTRLRTARRELRARRRYDHVVVNDRLGGTVKAIRRILRGS